MNNRTCLWEEDDGIYETECFHTFEFIYGSVAENNFKFCPFCGGQILVTVEFGDLEDGLE